MDDGNAGNDDLVIIPWSKWDHRISLNVDEEEVRANIASNLDLGLQEVDPHEPQFVEIQLLCGGPSLGDFVDEIHDHAKSGMPTITVNGTYNWALEHNVIPGAQIIVDARDFNKRFVEPVLPECKYLLSSQCHHDLVASVPKEQVWLWHSGGSELLKSAIEAHAAKTGQEHSWYPVMGGSTVALRALPLLTMLGFRKINIYGLDSCHRNGRHHAYEQKENDGNGIINIRLAGKWFSAEGWMIEQAMQAQNILGALGHIEGFEVAIHGDGLIAAILEEAAQRRAENGSIRMASL